MREFTKLSLVSMFTLALSAAFLPGTAMAQEEAEEEYAACTAEANVASIVAGETAVPVSFRLSEDIGAVSDIDSPTSGLVLSSPEDLRVDMANPEATPEPIEMAADAENTVNLWLNSADAQAGQHEFFLISEQGRCAATVTIEGEAL